MPSFLSQCPCLRESVREFILSIPLSERVEVESSDRLAWLFAGDRGVCNIWYCPSLKIGSIV
jgi:hypothetical protein